MSHLKETEQNYIAHLFRAWKISFVLLVHGVLPNVWKTKASDLLCKERLGDDATRAYLLKTLWQIDERPLSDRPPAGVWDRLSTREVATMAQLGVLRRAEEAKTQKTKKKTKKKKK